MVAAVMLAAAGLGVVRSGLAEEISIAADLDYMPSLETFIALMPIPEPITPDQSTGAVPAGFENLIEPQTNVIDVYYNGRILTSAVATYAPGSITFDDPDAIVDLMEDVDKRAAVTAALTGPLKTHGDLVCLPGETLEDEGCGVLQPTVAGVVFDRNAFRADVFVNGTYRAVQGSIGARYLEPSDGDPAVLSYLSGIISGGDQQTNDYDILNHTILGFEDNRVVSDLLYDNRDGFFLDQGQFISDQEAWRLQGGLFRTAPLEAVAQEKMIGVGIGTQLDSRMDLDLVTGTPLVLFLPVRSKVDIFGNGRLLASQTYDAGNQVLNTATLPPGSYEVTLRIQEIGGGTREETRFFAKTPELPPSDAPTYVFQIGQLIDDDVQGRDGDLIGDVTSTHLFRAGTVHRVDDQTGWFADLMGSTDQVLLQTGGVFLDESTRLQGGVIATTEQDYGYFLRYTDRFDNLGMNLSLRQIFAGKTREFRDPDIFDPFINDSQQFNGALSYRFPDWSTTVSMVGSYSVEDDLKAWSFGPQFTSQVFYEDGLDIQWTGSVTQSDREFLALTQLRFSYVVDNWTYQAALGYRHSDPRPNDTSDNGSGPEGDVLVVWDDQDLVEGDLSLRAGAVKNVFEDSIYAGGDYANDIGRVGFDYETAFHSGGSFTTYAGSFDVNLIGNPDGFAFGGPALTESGVMVLLDGNTDPDRTFLINVDGDPQDKIRLGESVFLPLPPYATYEISLTDDTEGFVHLDRDSQLLTLFPGNAVSVHFRADELVAIFGRIVNEFGDPVADGRIDGAIGIASTDSSGFFQTEVTTARRLAVTPPGEAPCAVDLPELPGELYADLGVLTCEPIDESTFAAIVEIAQDIEGNTDD
ncbi:MAG: TcfC E-set like domain-containing protein [Pseudomonadota bacterium]